MPISPDEFRSMTDNTLAEWHRMTLKLDALHVRAIEAEEREAVLKGDYGVLVANLRALRDAAVQLLDILASDKLEEVREQFGGEVFRAWDDLEEAVESAHKSL